MEENDLDIKQDQQILSSTPRQQFEQLGAAGFNNNMVIMTD